MARIILFVLLAFVSLAYAARSNICLASGSTIYKPLQLYPQDCPNAADNCMAAVYKYNATQFKSLAPKTLQPAARESLVYMTQDESDNLDVVVMTATSYKNNVIQTLVEVDGAASGATTLVRDDPLEDQWTWDPATNRGNFTWLLQPSYTDGVVLGHFKLIDNYCFRVAFKPNWNGAIANIVFLSGNVTKPIRVLTKPLTTTSTYFEFCSFPQAIISKTDSSCRAKGTATAMALNGTATYRWEKKGTPNTFVGTTSTISNLDAGTYTVTVTVNGCSATRDVTIDSVGSPITVSSTVVDQTRTKLGKITLSVSGGFTPYKITWTKSGFIVAANVTTVNVATGTYDVTITDGCSSETRSIFVAGPDQCHPGSRVEGDGCVACAAGTYSDTYEAAACTVCPAGSRNGDSNSTSCSRCPANTRNNGGSESCDDCGENMQSGEGSGVCMDCPLGTTRSVGGSSCTTCSAGSYRCAATGGCLSCPAGTFSSAGAFSCEMCNPGSSSITGSSSCDACATNTYAAAGSSSCTACATGLQSAAGSSAMLSCM